MQKTLTRSETNTSRWRMLIPGRTPSHKQLSGDEEAGSKVKRRRHRRAHTIDHTQSNIASNHNMQKDSSMEDGRHASDLDAGVNTSTLSPPHKPSSRGSLLQRFLTSTSRRRSQTNISGEGSTVSRLTDDEQDPMDSSSPAPHVTRRATMDTIGGGVGNNFSSCPSSAKHSAPMGSPRSGGLRNVLRRFSGDGPLGGYRSTSQRRRGSKDSFLDSEFPSINMGEEEYKDTQALLQSRAGDLHKSGQLKEAISQWVECLALAEENVDSVANKTEFLCVLVDLHLQVAQGQKEYGDETREATSGATPGSECSSHDAIFHRRAAKRYVHRIKPAFVKAHWWQCTSVLVQVLVEAEAWELAIQVADQLADEPGYQSPDHEQLATIHFQIASQKLDSHRQGEALQHLQATAKNLQQIPAEKRDMTMYTQVLQLLATEYSSHGQHALALDAYQEELKCAPAEKHASLYCQMAQVHIVTQQLDLALEQLEAAASSLDASEPSIRLQLLQTKGDVYCRLGRTREALEVYQRALEEVVNPAEKAKLLYTLGRLCARLKRTRQAISYFSQEMNITEAELGKQHMSVSRVLHEMAKLYDEGLGEHKMALMKLHKALHIELGVLQECHYAITKCPKCNQVTHRMCGRHANLQRDVSNQIRETKKVQGRIHFKLGDLEKALKTSFDGTERTVMNHSSADTNH